MKEGPGEYFSVSRRRVLVGEWAQDTMKTGVFRDADFPEFQGKKLTPEELDTMLGPVDPPPPYSYKDRAPLGLPVLKLKESDRVLADAVQAVRKDRAAAREAPEVDMEEALGEEQVRVWARVFGEFDTEDQGKIRVSVLSQVLSQGWGRIVGSEEAARALVELGKRDVEKGELRFFDVLQVVYFIETKIRVNLDGKETSEEEEAGDEEFETGEWQHQDENSIGSAKVEQEEDK
jgi:hypothetical protein